MTSEADMAYFAEVEGATKEGKLIASHLLIQRLSLMVLPKGEKNRVFEAISGQVRVAKNKGATKWLKAAAKHADTLQMHDRAWICRNIWDIGKRPAREELGMTDPLAGSRDIRLAQDPTIESRVENAAEVVPATDNVAEAASSADILQLEDEDMLDLCESEENKLLEDSPVKAIPSGPAKLSMPEPVHALSSSFQEEAEQPMEIAEVVAPSAPPEKDQGARPKDTKRSHSPVRYTQERERSRDRRPNKPSRRFDRERPYSGRWSSERNAGRERPYERPVVSSVAESGSYRGSYISERHQPRPSSSISERHQPRPGSSLSDRDRSYERPDRRHGSDRASVSSERAGELLQVTVYPSENPVTPTISPVQDAQQQHRCIVPGCGIYTGEPQVHAFSDHIPTVFDERLGSEVTNRRLTALKLAAAWLFGVGSTLKEMAELIDSMALLKPGDNIVSERQKVAIQAICNELQLSAPPVFTLQPMNSPAVMCHWRALMVMIAQLEPRYRLLFRERFSYDLSLVDSSTRSSESMVAVDMEDSTRHVSVRAEVIPAASGSATTASPPEAYDSHCHLDRTQLALGLSLDSSVEQVTGRTDAGTRTTKLVGAVLVFCDPKTYPSPRKIRALVGQGYKVAVGLHPRHCNNYSSADLSLFRSLHEMPEVAGFGEVGIDRTAPSSQWARQLDLLSEILGSLGHDQVLVIHCRRIRDNHTDDVYEILLQRLRHRVSPQQSLHLHCFDGDRYTVARWTHQFPRIYFGYTSLVSTFSRRQQEGLRAVADDRILAETDSPYFAVRHLSQVNNPGLIGWMVDEIARVRGASYEEMLALTTANARHLYG